MTTRKIVFTYFCIALIAVAPLLSVLLSSAIAAATGSRLDEAGVHPCIVLGVDLGPLLNFMFVCGWFMLLTIPVGLLAMLAFTVLWLIQRYRAKRA